MILIGITVTIYLYARKAVKNEPLKGNIESFLSSVNVRLSLYKNQKPKLLLNSLLELSRKVMLYSLISYVIIRLFPDRIQNYFVNLVAPILVISILLQVSISWIHYHNKTLKEFFLSYPVIFLLFTPLIVFFMGEYFGDINFDITNVFYPFKSLIDKIGIFYFQLIWFVVLSISFYLGTMIIAFPIYLMLYTLIVLTSLLIKFLEKYIDIHILDGIVATIGLITAFCKIYL